MLSPLSAFWSDFVVEDSVVEDPVAVASVLPVVLVVVSLLVVLESKDVGKTCVKALVAKAGRTAP